MNSSNSLLHQKSFVRTKKFSIEKDSLNVQTRTWLTYKKYQIPFEKMSNEVLEMTTYSKPLLWTSLIMGFLSITIFVSRLVGEEMEVNADLLWGTLSVLFGIATWFTKQSLIIVLGTDKSALFMKNKPSENEVRTFIEKVLTSREKYIDEILSSNSSGDSIISQLERLTWLKSNKSISEDEFEILKKELMLNTKQKKEIGFGS